MKFLAFAFALLPVALGSFSVSEYTSGFCADGSLVQTLSGAGSSTCVATPGTTFVSYDVTLSADCTLTWYTDGACTDVFGEDPGPYPGLCQTFDTAFHSFKVDC